MLVGSAFVVLATSCAPDPNDLRGAEHDHMSMPVDSATVMGAPDRPIVGQVKEHILLNILLAIMVLNQKNNLF